ncbi:hypothetical protein N7493_005118 [Penicillium malachiteum]|uniref:Uncharacterized protein n=1 Tax=Penicillium malachiteum TaxID=1324776 RepID=A0AAD6HMB6_9EURO|nr:hypothetical protein N7493_005118 [Penicillium malachiteum]
MEPVMASELTGGDEVKGEHSSRSVSPLDLPGFPDISTANVEKEAGNDHCVDLPLRTESEPAGQESKVVFKPSTTSPAPVGGFSASPAPTASSAPTRVPRQRMNFHTPKSLPKADEPLQPDQLRELFRCAPCIRKSYNNYFTAHGHLRTEHHSLIFEKNDKGELRFPDDVLASNVPSWRERLKAFENRQRQNSVQSSTVRSHAQGEDQGVQGGRAREPEPKRKIVMPMQAVKRPAKETEQRPSAEIKKKKQTDTYTVPQNTSTRNMSRPTQRRNRAPALLTSGLPPIGQAQIEAQTQAQTQAQLHFHVQSQSQAPPDDPLFVPQPGPPPRVSETIPEGQFEDFSTLFNANGSVANENDFHGYTGGTIPLPGPSVPFHVNQTSGMQLVNSSPISYEDIAQMESFLDQNPVRMLSRPPESMPQHHPNIFHPRGLMEFIRSITVQINRLNKALLETRACGRNLDIQSAMTRCLVRLYQLRMTCLDMENVFRRDSMLHGT